MIAIRQVHEHLADVIEVPSELRNRKAEVIFLSIDGTAADAAIIHQGTDASTASKVTPDAYFGALPDFPERECQGTFDSRLELN